MLKPALITLAGVMLTACQATAPQQKTSADDPSGTCYQGLVNYPELNVLVPKIGSLTNADAASLEVRASTATPTETEKAAISKLATLRQGCFEMGRDFRARYAPPAYIAIVEEAHAKGIALLAKLYSGQMNYGQYATERAEFAASMRVKQANARTQAAQANQQAAAAQQAQSAAELNNALMLMQMSRPAPAPMLNNNISCTSQNLNGTVHTNCR